MAARGSFRLAREVNQAIANAQRIGNWQAIDKLLDIIMAHSEIEAPAGVDVREALADYPMKDIVEMVIQIGGGRVTGVPPTNGG
jgi:hypothetical protein